jgi:hypothetical protein
MGVTRDIRVIKSGFDGDMGEWLDAYVGIPLALGAPDDSYRDLERAVRTFRRIDANGRLPGHTKRALVNDMASDEDAGPMLVLGTMLLTLTSKGAPREARRAAATTLRRALGDDHWLISRPEVATLLDG